MEEMLARAFDHACAELNRTAMELGAESAAVLLSADKRVEVTHFWSAGGNEVPEPLFSGLQRNRYESLTQSEGLIEAGSPPAQFLQETISRRAQWFLLHRWPLDRHAVVVVFGFADPLSRGRRITGVALQSLNLVGLATWSAREITRLRAELKATNKRLAGRKLVEKAKGIVQVERGISEGLAYEHLRDQSRKRRMTLTKLAEEILRVRGFRFHEDSYVSIGKT